MAIQIFNIIYPGIWCSIGIMLLYNNIHAKINARTLMFNAEIKDLFAQINIHFSFKAAVNHEE